MSSSFLLAMGLMNSEISHNQQLIVSVVGVMRVVHLETSHKIHITCVITLQLIYFRDYESQCPSTRTLLQSVDETVREEQENITHTEDLVWCFVV